MSWVDMVFTVFFGFVCGFCFFLWGFMSCKKMNECSLSDILEKEVEEKYFLSEYAIEKLSPADKARLWDRLFVLQPYFRADYKVIDIEQLYFDVMKIRIVPYSIDVNGYAQIYKVINEWSQFVNDVTQSQFMDDLRFMEENL